MPTLTTELHTAVQKELRLVNHPTATIIIRGVAHLITLRAITAVIQTAIPQVVATITIPTIAHQVAAAVLLMGATVVADLMVVAHAEVSAEEAVVVASVVADIAVDFTH